MVFENSGFYLKEALHSIKRNILINIATFISFTTILIILGAFLLIYANMNLFLENMESQLEIIAYLEDNISEKEINGLNEKISNITGINEIKYISKEDAFKNLLTDLGSQQDILTAIEANPLPDSYIIRLTDNRNIHKIADSIAKFNHVDEVEYGKGIAEKLLKFTSIFRKVGLIILGFLIFSSILIISNIIKITVYTRKNEIEIMNLAGATAWFVRWPFIIAGFLQGFISAIFAVSILYKTYFFTINTIQRNIPFLTLIWDKLELLPIGLAIIILGSLIGITGSLFSVGKYLND